MESQTANRKFIHGSAPCGLSAIGQIDVALTDELARQIRQLVREEIKGVLAQGEVTPILPAANNMM